MALPLVCITMGDPAGIGPETIVAAWPTLHAVCRPVVAGHPAVMERAIELRRLPIKVDTLIDVTKGEPSPEVMPCWFATWDEAVDTPPAIVDPRGGQAAYDALVAAAQAALAGKVDAIVTAPLNKAALHAAGHHYPGHTELLAELCGIRADDVAMMLYLARGGMVRGQTGLGVAHVTLHMALRDVFAHLSVERILASARLAGTVMGAFAGQTSRPRIGVAALNPHAGEEGIFGDEESRIIAPAVAAGRAAGLDLTGPLPCDTLMVRAAAGDFDAVVAMYHDQGHIALKLLGMHRAVNITLGLPIVRTSVAHGTAFDLAWHGKADASSMIEAVRVAAQLVTVRDRLTWNRRTEVTR